MFEVVVVVVLGVVIIVCLKRVKDALWPPTAPPPAPAPAPAPTPTPPATPPPPPTPPTMTFPQAPTSVRVGVKTKFTLDVQLNGFAYRDEDCQLTISAPRNSGVMTDVLGLKHAGPWAPADGAVMTTMKTSHHSFSEVKAGQIVIEVVIIDYLTPPGAPADCVLTATHVDTGTSASHRFRSVQ